MKNQNHSIQIELKPWKRAESPQKRGLEKKSVIPIPFPFSSSVLTFLLFFTQLSCTGGSGGGDFAQLEAQNGTNNVPCKISQQIPVSLSLKVASTAGVKTNFTITPSTSSCKVFFYLNGNKINTDSSTFVEVDSSLLTSGTNKIRVEASNDLAKDFLEWSIEKNSPPTCTQIYPTATTLNITEGSTQLFTVNGISSSNGPLDFRWTIDGKESSALVKTITGTSASQAQFSPTGDFRGLKTIEAVVSDGLDTVTCSWTTNVGTNCAITEKTPNIPSLRMANQGGSSSFNVTTTDSSCLVSWTLNGLGLPGNGLSTLISSSQLTTGSNLLQAQLTSSSGVTTKNWTVVKNTPPSCTQNPSSSGVQVSVGGTLNLTANIVDVDSDPVNLSWTVNGSTPSSPVVVISNGSNSSSATFNPTTGNIGFNSFNINLSDGYDTSICSWSVQVNPRCSIMGSTPAATNVTIAATGVHLFGITPNDANCNVSWTLNGVNLGISSVLLSILSTSFSGLNTLVGRVNNSSSSDTFTWNVTKNSPPTCSAQSPSGSGFIFAPGSSQSFILDAGESDPGQILSYTWSIDGNTPGAGYFSEVSSGMRTTGTWTAQTSQVGSHNLKVAVSDGYDTTSCSWQTEVMRSCMVSSFTPATNNFRVSHLGSTITSFGVVPNDSSCNISWKLNGVASPSSDNFMTFLSSDLSSSNSIVATLANQVSTTTQTWSVTKNSVPVCQIQNPVANGNAVNLGSTKTFSFTATDSNSDTLTYNWAFDGSNTGLFSNITAIGHNGAATFTPGLGQVGLGHLVTAALSDGYDVSYCSWGLDVIDPNSAQILSWSPLADPIILLSNGSKDFSVSALGTGLTYAWYIDNVAQPSLTTSSITLDYTSMAVGSHVVKVVVTDTYSSQVSHSFNVKRNAKPTITSFSPNVAGLSSYKIGYNSSLNFGVSASDSNGDVLTYTWTLDNSPSPKFNLSGGGANASLSPGGDTLLLGSHTVALTVSDGYESTSQAWTIGINYFSDDCNNLYNSSPSGTNGGRVCTLVGNPSMGHTLDVTTDPSLFRVQPFAVIEVQNGIYIISDSINHSVILYNSNATGNFTDLGSTVLPKTAQVLIGNGAPGLNSEANVLTPTFSSIGSPPVSMPQFKLNSPRGLAYDSVQKVLYIADSGNHRVVALNSSGQAYRILGQPGAAASNNAATNMNGVYGNTQSCNAPYGLTISGRDLYVACYGQHAIKKVNIDSPSVPATYGLTTIIVGRLNGSSQTTYLGTAGWLHGNGLGGSSNNSTTGSVVYTLYPSDVSVDKNGVVYWIEKQGGNHGLRIRAYNPATNGTIALFPTLTPELTSSTSLLFQSLDLTGAIGTYNTSSSRAVSVTAGTPFTFLVGSQSKMVTGGCHAVGVTLVDATPLPISYSSPLTVTMTANFAATFYSDPACTSSLPGGAFTLPVGEAQYTVFAKPTTNNTYTFTATSGAYTGFISAITVAAAGAGPASSLTTFASSKFKYTDCLPVELEMRNASGVPTPSGSLRYVAPGTNNIGTFYSDSGCTSIIDRVAFASTDYNKVVYYNRKVIIPPDWVQSVAGYDNILPGSYSEYGDNIKIGEMKLLSPTGLDVLPNGTTGYPNAFVWASNQSNHNSANLLNVNSSDITYGGRVFSSYRSSVILGLPSPNASSPTSMTAGYNGDEQPAWGSSINSPGCVKFNLTGTKILVADWSNRRFRSLDLDSNAYVHSLGTLGRDRWRQNVTSSTPTDTALYSPYKIEFFNGSLYISETNNHWIRRVNLTTGFIDNVAGNGLVSSYTEGNDAIAEGMRNPRGFKVVAYPDTLSPTNYVLFYAESPSNNCLVRAVNLSGPTIYNFFGVGSLLPGKVKTLAGDPTFACSTWSSSGNTDGMIATSARLNGPEDLAYMEGNLYILEYNDHCILKLSSNGTLSRPQGASSCSTTAPSNGLDSTMDTMLTRYPRAFAPDPSLAGNYFFVDRYADGTGWIRYINTLVSSVSFGNTVPTTVNARTSSSAPFMIKTIYQYTAASGSSNIGGIAAWTESPGTNSPNDKICWSSGDLSTGAQGAHAIYCANRNQDDTGTLTSGPSNTSAIRGGASLNREQESIGRLNATFYSPYGLAFDVEGNLYVSEYNNHIIRMIRRWW